MLRIATLEDIDLITKMSMVFLNTTEMKSLVEEDYVRNIVESIISDDNSEKIMLVHGDYAFLAGMKVPFPYGPHSVATEIGWWVEPDKRKSGVGEELLEAFEYWAKKINCSLINMVTLDDQLGKFYEKKGYRLSERSYVKEL